MDNAKPSKAWIRASYLDDRAWAVYCYLYREIDGMQFRLSPAVYRLNRENADHLKFGVAAMKKSVQNGPQACFLTVAVQRFDCCMEYRMTLAVQRLDSLAVQRLDSLES